MHLNGVVEDVSLSAPQVDQGLLMLPAPTTISKGQKSSLGLGSAWSFLNMDGDGIA
jgi:hypothetical protein